MADGRHSLKLVAAIQLRGDDLQVRICAVGFLCLQKGIALVKSLESMGCGASPWSPNGMEYSNRDRT
ncbi:Glutarate-semialdehyde dehydrogenase [Venturia inaequalis]|nr:Glutarate-semialdehyde dehydrogenase [Venturia inaequalis]